MPTKKMNKLAYHLVKRICLSNCAVLARPKVIDDALNKFEKPVRVICIQMERIWLACVVVNQCSKQYPVIDQFLLPILQIFLCEGFSWSRFGSWTAAWSLDGLRDVGTLRTILNNRGQLNFKSTV